MFDARFKMYIYGRGLVGGETIQLPSEVRDAYYALGDTDVDLAVELLRNGAISVTLEGSEMDVDCEIIYPSEKPLGQFEEIRKMGEAMTTILKRGKHLRCGGKC